MLFRSRPTTPVPLKAELVLSGTGVVGLALLATRRAIVATSNALFSLDWNVEGQPLLG